MTVDELDVTATLTRTVEKFARKIEQVAIIKEVGILVVLAGTSSPPCVSIYCVVGVVLTRQIQR